MIPPSSNDDPSWLTRAWREVGVKEIKGGKSNPRILQYRSATKLRPWVGDDGQGSAWCADFVGWCLEEEGVRSTRSAAAASYRTYGKETYPCAGCIVVFDKTHVDAAGTGHVGFLVGIEGGELLVLGGNQGNEVCVRRYGPERVVAYRWPVF